MNGKTPLVYWNGDLRPAEQIAVPIHDLGFVMGVTVSERLRTFGGRLFRPEDHFRRLQDSLAIAGLVIPESQEDLLAIAQDLVDRHRGLLDSDDDIGVTVFVTPGVPGDARPTVCLECQPLAFHTWCDLYEHGQRLAVTSIRQVPTDCWPAALKCRSRMHYYLADQEAKQRDPHARALLLDHQGWVTEASTANLVLIGEGQLVSPPQETVLPGISLSMVRELAADLGLEYLERPLKPEELVVADEVLLCSTSPCVWPVSMIDGRPVAGRVPGDYARKLLERWGESVGVDIPVQAERFAQRKGWQV